MRHHIGIGMQMLAMAFLPLIILYQLNFGFQLIIMPICLTSGIVVFGIGTYLRDKT